jgi:hypothetical protein
MGGMDPVTVGVAAAIAAGAAAGLNESVAQAVKDAYAALRKMISSRYGEVDVAPLERRPGSSAKRDSLAEDLEMAGAGGDLALRDAAVALLEAVRTHAGDVGAAVGVDLKRVEAAALRVGVVESAGTGVRVEDGRFDGDITIDGVRAGRPGLPDPGSARG